MHRHIQFSVFWNSLQRSNSHKKKVKMKICANEFCPVHWVACTSTIFDSRIFNKAELKGIPKRVYIFVWTLENFKSNLDYPLYSLMNWVCLYTFKRNRVFHETRAALTNVWCQVAVLFTSDSLIVVCCALPGAITHILGKEQLLGVVVIQLYQIQTMQFYHL